MHDSYTAHPFPVPTPTHLPGLFPLTPLQVCLGMHPWEANLEKLPRMLALIRDNAAHLVGVGEVGLDYMPKTLLRPTAASDGGHGDAAATAEGIKAVQKECLVQQARLAMELDLPLNVHSCSAGHHTIDLLRSIGVTRAVFHAFDGKVRPYTSGYYWQRSIYWVVLRIRGGVLG